MSKTTIAIGAIVCCFIFASDCTADLLINIAIESVQETAPKIRQSQLQLCLGNHYLRIVESDLELIYDFDTQRKYWIDRTEHYYGDTSLYAAVGGREHELKNRQYLWEPLKSPKRVTPQEAGKPPYHRETPPPEVSCVPLSERRP